jgi:uncharacterized glyoxalase superfamily protein PhnB
MKPLPAGWPRLSPTLFYADAAAAIDWLCRAFDFQVRVKIEGQDGVVHHSELVYREAVVMVATESIEQHHASPRSLDGKNTQTLFLYVDEADAHFAQSHGAGAKVLSEPKLTDYGEEYWADYGYQVEDIGGHRWYFAQRIRNPPLTP